MKKVILAVLLALLIYIPQSMAQSLNGVMISSLNIDRPLGELLFISTNVTPTPHGCHSDGNWNFVLPIATNIDKQIHASLLAAMMSGKKVDIEGSGECSTFPAIEGIKRIRVYGQ